jgi:hypothetical protein
MTTVCLAIPPVDDNYPWRATKAGLERLGFTVHMGIDLLADALVTWSPWHGSRRQALESSYRAAGKPVIVMENGWLSPLHDMRFYQVALDGWNGTGRFPAGGSDRWRMWHIPITAWTERRDGYALIVGQRGHPSDDRTAVPGWHERLPAAELPVLRRHREATRPLLADLKGASEVHVWTSNAASVAVLAGVPVVQHGPNLMVSALASRPGAPLYRGERAPELERLAWAQWTREELAIGEPFARLLAA